MVHLHCWERGVNPQRPTDDGDAALDVRGEPQALYKFTSALHAIGFRSAGESFEGHQHRWLRDLAQIDVLIPRGVGETARKRKGLTGGTTLESPGSQQALYRSELVEVRVGTTEGMIRRPNLLGALVSKAAAHTNNDPYKARHVIDFAVLLSMVTRSDLAADQITKTDATYLSNMTAILRLSRELWAHLEGAEDGMARLSLALSQPADTLPADSATMTTPSAGRPAATLAAWRDPS